MSSHVKKTKHGSLRGTARKPGPNAGRKRLARIDVEKGESGFTATHRYKPEYGGTPKSDKHAFGDYEGLHRHLENQKGED